MAVCSHDQQIDIVVGDKLSEDVLWMSVQVGSLNVESSRNQSIFCSLKSGFDVADRFADSEQMQINASQQWLGENIIHCFSDATSAIVSDQSSFEGAVFLHSIFVTHTGTGRQSARTESASRGCQSCAHSRIAFCSEVAVGNSPRSSFAPCPVSRR